MEKIEIERKSRDLKELRLDIESCQNNKKREMITKMKKDLKIISRGN